ncbi:MAG: 2-amino-4-hydroxy-6-hydroxymethyldihydropteridine diphosphokinase [Candidatus Amulumruptor caecigallinarius]|nr:2-amino-4-hydroxy-6-hydroxymethyldihydropteridine diphosphokinase [Candidatus Amulumruptor caecigallinarius]MCM1395939.1 2-amino-4-hydroxy-6-hydroxymethyldihydropteridine diphosphokinase [Candidatus Amulumruptor caecigallinarius]MCM1452974.1 2-amino-4-hydroxy-6-hydroxymethyldihydropteridine diphosphokinase [bacterium]
MPRAYVNTGSNIGDREGNIARAVTAISALSVDSVMVSDSYESEPWGYISANTYINKGVSFDTLLGPEELLAALLTVQNEINPASHRREDGSYMDRVIDIDLIAYEGVSIDSPTLTLPHPRAAQRQFVMLPLLQTLLPL